MGQEYDTRYDSMAVSPLFHRINLAMGAHDVSFSQRVAVRDALDKVPEDQIDGLTWEKLPQEARDAIEACEAEPRSSWEDPLDVPDDTSYMD